MKKQTLQTLFSSLGYKEVVTFRQSGNVVFSSDDVDLEVIKAKVETKLKAELGYDVAAFVRTFPQLRQIVDFAPFQAQAKEGTSFLVTFLKRSPDKVTFDAPVTIPKSTACIIAVRGAEAYSETHGGGEGGLPNPYLESKLKMQATTRNLKVVKDILEKFNEH